MRVFLLIFFVVSLLFSARVIETQWKPGEIFSRYLEANGIPVSLMKTIPADDLQFLSEIQAGETFHELRENGKLLQALIPLGEEMQIHITYDKRTQHYHFDITPVVAKTIRDGVYFRVRSNLYRALQRYTKNPRLGYLLKRYYRNVINFRNLRKGDQVAFIYTQKSRLGRPYGTPKIEAALIHTHGKNRFIFIDEEGTAYDDIVVQVTYESIKKVAQKGYFMMPVDRVRITSPFTYKRWHPVLKKYRPHLGVDLGGRRGTKIYATQGGRVIYAGWMGGYGKVVKISHARGYVSLYAHQSKIRVKRGQYVKRGQLIGYIGSTGRSTGPHLHFGLYRKNRAVNPMHYVKRNAPKRSKKIVQRKNIPLKGAKKNKQRMLALITQEPRGFKWDATRHIYDRVNDRKQYRDTNTTKG